MQLLRTNINKVAKHTTAYASRWLNYALEQYYKFKENETLSVVDEEMSSQS